MIELFGIIRIRTEAGFTFEHRTLDVMAFCPNALECLQLSSNIHNNNNENGNDNMLDTLF